MIETEGLDDLLAELSGFGQELQETTTTSLQEIARELPNKLRNQIFSEKTNRTGTLANSISTSVSQNQLNLEMVSYGYFQVFGVAGTALGRGTGVFGIPQSVLGNLDGTPNGGDYFAFRKIKHPGIFGVRTAKNTIVNLEDLIVATIVEE